MARPSIKQITEVDDAPKSDGVDDDDLAVKRRQVFHKLSQLVPGLGADSNGLALDAVFGHNGLPKPPSMTVADRSDRSEPVFGEHLGTPLRLAGAPANDDSSDRPGRGDATLVRLRAKLQQCFLALVTVSFLLAISGLVSQLGPAPANRYAALGLWPFALAGLLLACAFLSGLADLVWEASRREDSDRRDVADRAVQRAAETAGTNELIVVQMEEVLSDLALLRAQCVELGAVPRLGPADFALFSTKVDAYLSRLLSRIAEQGTLAEDRAVRENAHFGATALVDERMQEIARDLADLRQSLHDLVTIFGNEPPDAGPVVAAVETRIASLSGQLEQLQGGVTRSTDELRLALEALPAALMNGSAGSQVSIEPSPKTFDERERGLAGPLDAEPFGEALPAMLQPDALHANEERYGSHENVRTTLDAMFDLDALLLAWEAYRTFGQADFTPIYRPGFGDHMPAVRRHLSDAAFAHNVERFLDRHEQVLMVAARSGSEADLLRNLWSTDGRCYTLLAHAFRRLSSTEPA